MRLLLLLNFYDLFKVVFVDILKIDSILQLRQYDLSEAGFVDLSCPQVPFGYPGLFRI